MQSRLLINIVLFLIVAGLAIFLIRQDDSAPTEVDVTLTTFESGSINEISIIRRDLDDIVFIKEGDQWSMQSPFVLPANPVRINTILKILQAYSYAQLDVKNVELKHFILDDPVVSLKFNETQIDFGDTSPLGKQRYVLLNETVHLINDSLYQQLLTSPTFFVSPKLLPGNSSITALTLPDYQLRQVEGIWMVEPPVAINADKIIQLVNAWRDAGAITLRAFSDNASEEKIIVELMSGETIEFVTASTPPRLILARPEFNLQYHISGYDADRLLQFNNDNGKKELSVTEPLPDTE